MNTTCLEDLIISSRKFTISILGEIVMENSYILHLDSKEKMVGALKAELCKIGLISIITLEQGKVIEKCKHSRNSFVKGCDYCFNRSFASKEMSMYWDYSLNDKLPYQVCKGSKKKYFLRCPDCPHSFDIGLCYVKKEFKCPYCNGKKLCDDECDFCFNKSFASEEKALYWDEEKNGISPRKILKYSNFLFWFKCNKCPHNFNSALNSITQGSWCPYCGHQKLCEDNDCLKCFQNSFASGEKAIYWDYSKNEKSPREVFKYAKAKYFFLCPNCPHSFDAVLSSISQGSWCRFCVKQDFCSEEKCEFCFKGSFASHPKASCWSKKNKLSAREVALKCNSKYYFDCDVCFHTFDAVVATVAGGTWCSFCYNLKLCAQDCKICFDKSFASCNKAIYWSKLNKVTPRQVLKNTHEMYFFDCPTCKHVFDSRLYDIISGNWCRFCKGRVCGKEKCKICTKVCAACLTNKGQKYTRKRGLFLCKVCFKRCIKEDPEETPLQERAKITLEIYTLAEIQRLSLEKEDSFLISEPTVWDCPILPELSYKPDQMWIFDKYGNVFTTAGACKISKNKISYVLMLEILEGNSQHHSKHRNIADNIREQEIRQCFSPINIGVVYLTIAHNNHPGASKEDIFFVKKGNGEYEIMENREKEWNERIETTRNKLVEFYENKSNETYHIGN